MSLRGIAVSFFLLTAVAVGQQNTLEWRPTAALSTARANACAVRMGDGRVLITGGSGNDGPVDSVELFRTSPEEIFEPVTPMRAPRSGHACVLLGDGRVLVAGGETVDAPAAELYDPILQEWTAIPSVLPGVRGPGLTVTPLADGRILLIGGLTPAIEAFDPDSNELRPLPVSLTSARQHHAATLLADGRVLITGGRVEEKSVETVELYDPIAETLNVAPSLAFARAGHTATLLPDRRVLIAGGAAGAEERSELEVFVPGLDAFATLPAKLQAARQGHIAVLMETNGAVLLAGGSAAGEALGTTEIFEPWDDRITPAGSLTAPRVFMASILLEDGRVLAVGGRNAEGASQKCGVLSPSFQFTFTQSRYRPLERAAIQGSVGVTLSAPLSLTLQLTRINLSTGESTVVNDRLLLQNLTIPTSGKLSLTSIMNVSRNDIGSDFVLTIFTGREARAQLRFSVKLATTITLSALPPIITGQPVRARVTLTADGAPVDMSGTRTLTVGTRASSTITTSTVVPSITSDFSICCEQSAGVVQASARYSGNNFLEPATIANTITIGSPTPAVRIVPASLNLQSAGQLAVEVVWDAASVDPKSPPGGTVTLSKNGVVIATAALSGNLVVDSSSARKVTFPYTPTAVDRRTTPCFTAQYGGDPRYTGAVSALTCLSIGPAATALEVSMGASTTYRLGESQTLTARLTWPDSVGIVGRTVNVVAAGRPIATINLTPDPTGRGIATGSATLKLPFQANALKFTYPQSGDLSVASNSIETTMAPVSTTMVAIITSPTFNPFTIRYTLQLNTGGVPLPPGTNIGGSIQFFDGTELIGTQNLPPLPTGPGVTDGTSNTINVSETVGQSGILSNVIRPLGQRTIRVRFTGSPLFTASEMTVFVNVQ